MPAIELKLIEPVCTGAGVGVGLGPGVGVGLGVGPGAGVGLGVGAEPFIDIPPIVRLLIDSDTLTCAEIANCDSTPSCAQEHH
ncbi:MAG: hypothetical protein EKK54_00865 [Neisseriaceae bacterium]|nr:MAG: hypothetical protein EKK54_00865 [Neisseriaceae bacterium]